VDNVKVFVAGVVAIGLVTAFGLHASGLTGLTRVGGKAASGVLNTAERG
jgi:hypothetical protein